VQVSQASSCDARYIFIVNVASVIIEATTVGVEGMQVRRDVIVRVSGRAGQLDALFDPGSSVTIMGYEVVRDLFGGIAMMKLARARWVVLANGDRVMVEAYVNAEILVDEYMVEDRIYLSRDMVRKATIEGREIKLPDLIIGAPTMESWGIELDLKEGKIKSCREGFMLI